MPVLANLPSLDTLLTALAAPKPGTTNCVMVSVSLPAKPSGSTPSCVLISSAVSVTDYDRLVSAAKSITLAPNSAIPCGIAIRPETTPSPNS